MDAVLVNVNATLIATNATMSIAENLTDSPGRSNLNLAFLTMFVIILMITTIVGNVTVIIAIATDRTLRTIQNWFLASLACSDCLVGLIVMPWSLVNEFRGNCAFGVWGCQFLQATYNFLCAATTINIVLISVDRYLCITKAIAYLKKQTSLRAALMISSVWVSAFMVGLPLLVGWQLSDSPESVFLYQLTDDLGYLLYTLGYFCIPCSVIVFVYIRIYMEVRSRSRRFIRKKRSKKKQDLSVDNINATYVSETEIEPETDDGSDSCIENSVAVVKECHDIMIKTISMSDQQHQKIKEASNSGPQVVLSNGDQLRLSSVQPSSETEPPQESKFKKVFQPFGQKPNRKYSKEHRDGIALARMEPRVIHHERQKKRIARRKERRATLILGFILVSFILPWLPYYIVYIMGAVSESYREKISDGVAATVFWIANCNFSFNPIIYTVFIEDFRRAFKNMYSKFFQSCSFDS